MCGIVGYSGKRSAQEVLLNGLEKLEYRGYDSAGVALALEGGIHVVKSKGRLEVLRRKLEAENLPESFCGIGHTRWATHGEPSDVNSHPHSTPRVSIVHNGIIENYGPLKADLMAKGVTFESETDTEVLVKLIDYFCCAQPKQSPLAALREALAMVRGSYALGVLFREEPDTIYAVKKESPLIVGWGEGENFVASDIPALLKYTRRYSVLEEGDMAVVKADGIRFYDAFGKPVEREVLTADWDEEAAEKGGYPHFMLKEIHEQPAAITATVSPRVENGMPDLRIPELSDEKLRSIKNIHLVACGTAMHAGMVGKTAIERLARVSAEVDIASEFRYRDPILDPDDLVIIISQSGETSDTLAALRLAKSRGVPVLAVVNVVGSSIARAADYVLYTYAGPEIAVASTKAYMVQLCTLYLFAFRLAYARGRLSEAETRRLTAELLRAGEVIGVEAVAERGDGVDIADGDGAGRLALVGQKVAADAAAVREGDDGVELLRSLEHQAGQPVARDGAAAVADGYTAGDALVGNAEDLGHVALHRIPGGVADGENGRVELRVALGVIEVLGVVAAGSVHIARVHDRDFLRLGVELDLGVGIALRLAVALNIGYTVVGDAVGNAVGVAADDEIDKIGGDAVWKAARAGVRHNDDDVRVLGCNDGLDLRIELLNARVDVIRGDLGGHDIHGVVGDVADKCDLHTGLVNDDIVLDKGGAVRRTCIIEIIGQNGDITVALELTDLISISGSGAFRED